MQHIVHPRVWEGVILGPDGLFACQNALTGVIKIESFSPGWQRDGLDGPGAQSIATLRAIHRSGRWQEFWNEDA